ncbi:MAG: hypothetical protein IKS29_05130 [Oscillospiraceae bacterium]|nr:hypothetical protein [Oscillospiraceae bacterium]
MSEESKQARLQEKRRRALLTYLAILFCVAFLLVMLSFLRQLRQNNTTISELSQTSTSALANAQRLQEDNASLEKQVSQLQSEIAQMRTELSEAQSQAQAAQEEIAPLEEKLKEALDKAEALQAELDDNQERLKAYDLLSRLQTAPEAERQKLAAELEPLLKLLDEPAQEVFRELTAPAPESEEP